MNDKPLRAAIQIARRMSADPAAAVRDAERLEKVLGYALRAQQSRRRLYDPNDPLPSSGYRLSGVAAVAAGTTSPAYRLEWRQPGVVKGMRGSTLLNTPAELATMQVRVLLDGRTDLFSDGNTGVAVPMADLFNDASPIFRLKKRVERLDVWHITFTNTSALGVAMTPSLTFFLDGEDE